MLSQQSGFVDRTALPQHECHKCPASVGWLPQVHQERVQLPPPRPMDAAVGLQYILLWKVVQRPHSQKLRPPAYEWIYRVRVLP